MKELDWQPTINLREGLIKTIDYFVELRRSANGLESGKKLWGSNGSEQRRDWSKDGVEGQRSQVGLGPQSLS